ncbi:DUF1573 domain-containing protein [Flavobacterium okayamense]|uniref:DUF1573 domain-containing protein n=1 Tax=Flavobacterium okayamense TaxID=2830782 RepID=A0ABM7SDJ0_9FLAO|nr:DUF1573 domain-containing protein [Flavobacterium okayamense]BCY28824.1 hypothetical protein KK2020170_16920 [Flavobacterium okayamense]
MRKVNILAVSLVLGLMISCKDSENSKITDADLQALEAQKALAGKLPKVELDKDVHDFGLITDGDVVETEFIVKNTGEGDLIIADAKGSCGCTVPVWPKEPITSGQSAPIKVSFNSSGKVGQQSKTVTLTTNTEVGQETFTIKANVQPKPGKAVYQK